LYTVVLPLCGLAQVHSIPTDYHLICWMHQSLHIPRSSAIWHHCRGHQSNGREHMSKTRGQTTTAPVDLTSTFATCNSSNIYLISLLHDTMPCSPHDQHRDSSPA